MTYARVPDPLAGLIGPTWQWRRNEGALTVSAMLTLNADGTFVSVSVGGCYSSGPWPDATSGTRKP